MLMNTFRPRLAKLNITITVSGSFVSFVKRSCEEKGVKHPILKIVIAIGYDAESC